MIKFAFGLTAATTATLIALAPAPAAAQGAVSKMSIDGGQCPRGYTKSRRGSDTTYYCYPDKDAQPAYPKEGRCADGYKQDQSFCVLAAATGSSSSSSSGGPAWSPQSDAKGGKLAKPRKDVRCPAGWQTGESNLDECFTVLANPPVARASGGKGCAAGEFNEWGAWCTSNYEAVEVKYVDRAAIQDFNVMYTNGIQVTSETFSPEAKAYFEAKMGTAAPSSGTSTSASSSSDSSEPATQTAQCTTEGSATGAAIGGAVGGDAGAALGGMLGGLGKKKKKKGC